MDLCGRKQKKTLVNVPPGKEHKFEGCELVKADPTSKQWTILFALTKGQWIGFWMHFMIDDLLFNQFSIWRIISPCIILSDQQTPELAFYKCELGGAAKSYFSLANPFLRSGQI